MDESTAPLFQQVADLIADSIVDGSLAEGQRAPSTNELAEFHSINPATARKGLSILAEQGILEKRRGVGMFVQENAREKVFQMRTEGFAERYIVPLVDEAAKLGMDRTGLAELIEKVAESRGLYS